MNIHVPSNKRSNLIKQKHTTFSVNQIKQTQDTESLINIISEVDTDTYQTVL